MANDYGLDQKVNGVSMMQYMAELLEKNERAELELDRVKTANGTLKQMHNYSRLQMDAVKLTFKERELRLKEKTE